MKNAVLMLYSECEKQLTVDHFDNSLICTSTQGHKGAVAGRVGACKRGVGAYTQIKRDLWNPSSHQLPLNQKPLCEPKLTPTASNRRRLRSSSSSQLVIRRTRLSTVGDRAFPVAGSRLWNSSLPPDVTSAPTLTDFRNRLKTFLFSRSFPN